MTGMRPLRSLVLVIVLLAGAIAMLMSRDLARHRDGRQDPLGATLVPASSAGPLLVDSLRSGGEAERAGLHIGDRIEAVDNQAVRSRDDIERALAAHHPVTLHVRRDGRTFALTISSDRS